MPQTLQSWRHSTDRHFLGGGNNKKFSERKEEEEERRDNGSL